MKRACCFLALVLLLLLPGCGTEPIPALDAESVRLAESSDAVCLAYIMGYDDQEDGSVLLQCTAAQDCLGSLTDRGTALGPDELQTFLLRVEDGSRFQEEWMARIKDGKPARLLLFLKVTGERREQYDWDRGLGEYAVFVPNGEAGLRWEPGDREGLRYLQSLREYGKSHPREPLGDGICWTSHYID